MSLLTSTNERSKGDFFFTLSQGSITSLAGAGIIGTITNSVGTASHVFPYSFQSGTYYIQAQVEILVNATNANDILTCSIAQNGVLNADEIISSFSASGYNAGKAGQVMLTGYITTIPGSGLNLVVSGAVGSGSSYQIMSPTTSKVFIQKIA